MPKKIGVLVEIGCRIEQVIRCISMFDPIKRSLGLYPDTPGEAKS